MNWTEQHVLISGGGSGVGAEIARQMADNGARVTILGRRQQALDAVATETGALALCCDVTDAAAVAAAVASAAAQHGPVSVAVANAGAAPSMPFHKLSSAELDAVLGVNLKGVFHVWQATLGGMRKAGRGRLIAIASTAGLKGYPYVTAYCAAKHGVIGLTRALAHELGNSGITANAICPGFIETPLLERSLQAITAKTGLTTEQATSSLLAGNPQQRFIQTSEVAGTVLWLCSDAAASVNGHALSLSGGEI